MPEDTGSPYFQNQSQAPIRQPGNTNNRKQLLVLAAICVAVVISYLAYCYLMGENHTVYVVNGLEYPYTVLINGKSYNLLPRSEIGVRIKEGTVKIEVPDKKIGIEPEQVQIKTEFLSRPFSQKVFVLNPDRTAIILWQEMLYAVDADISKPVNIPESIYINKHFYEFDKIDYAFEEFPHQIKLPSGSKTGRKTRVELLKIYNLDALLGLIEKKVNKDSAKKFLMRCQQLHHDRSDYLYYLQYAYATEDEFNSFISELIKDRPIAIEIHKYYQTAMQLKFQDDELQTEYAGYLEKDPDNAALKYLVARINNNQDEAIKLYSAATADPAVAPFAWNGLSYIDLIQGNFEKAAEEIGKALTAAPENPSILDTAYQVYTALQRYDDAIIAIQKMLKEDEYNINLIENLVCLYALKDDRKSADKVINLFCKALKDAGHSEEAAQYRQNLNQFYVIAKEDLPAYLETLNGGDENWAAFINHIADKNWKDASDLVLKQPDDYGDINFLLYAAMRAVGDDETAQEHLDAGLRTLRNKPLDEYKRLADMLESDNPDHKSAMEIKLPPIDKCTYMLAFAYKFPDKKTEYLALARKLNFGPWLMHMLLKDPIEGKF